MKKNKNHLVIPIIVLFLGVFFLMIGVYWRKTVLNDTEVMEKTKQAIGEGVPPSEKEMKGSVAEKKTEDKKIDAVSQEKIPDRIFIDAPFLCQAPFGNWDEYHEDACEEASLIMLEYYLTGKNLNNDIGEAEIQKMIQFQMNRFGDYKDSSAKELMQIAEELYGRKNLEVIYDFPKSRIKEELAKGNPVILPVAGRLLGNPYFTPPGPLYHNVLAVGYDGDMIITNDPGTKRGEGYQYHIDVLYNAIHDFTGSKEDVLSGRKAMIVVR